MEFELEIIRWMQSFSNQFWDFFFQFWTMFGEELVIIGVLGFTYWCYDKKIGEALGITVFVSLVLNSFIKVLVQRPRPFQVDQTITNIRPQTSGGFAFPSGHTQGAATVFGGLAFWIRKRWLTIVVCIIIVMVAISRMYLGVHYLTDVLAGGALGLLIAFGLYRFFVRTEDRSRFYMIILVVAGLIFIGSYIYFLMTSTATESASDSSVFYGNLTDSAKMMGAIFGFVFGIGFEKRYVNFTTHRVLWKNLIRFAGGVIVVMAVRILLKAVFGLIVAPESLSDGEFFSASIAVIFDFVRYFAMVLLGIGIYPLLFGKLKF